MLDNISDKAAEILIDIGSVNFSPNKPFKLTSGKYSPVYCDCRRIISFPKERKMLMDFAINIISKKGISEFYKGSIAEDMVNCLNELGGLHTVEDFSKQKTIKSETVLNDNKPKN